MTIEQAKQFLTDTKNKIRGLEINKAKAEQQLEFHVTEKAKIIKEMEALGCTPENIDDTIAKLQAQSITIKQEIEAIFDQNDSNGGDNGLPY